MMRREHLTGVVPGKLVKPPSKKQRAGWRAVGFGDGEICGLAGPVEAQRFGQEHRHFGASEGIVGTEAAASAAGGDA